MMWRHVDLCSGIGGFALAARWAGMTTVGFCEIDPWCQRVLARHWPEAPIHGDLKTLTGDVVRGWGGGVVDVLTAGYPCQPFSVAGNRMGQEDDRHLWPWIAGICADVLPGWVVFENVVGHITMGLDDVLAELEGLGYTVWAAVVPAAGVGAPHFRERVWIVGRHRQYVADAADHGRQQQWWSGTNGQEDATAECGGCDDSRTETVGGMGDEADGLSGWVARRHGFVPWWRECVCGDYWCVTHDMHAAECDCPDVEELIAFTSPWWGGDPRSAFAEWWEEGCPRVAEGEVDRRHKLRALGNAIVPQVAYEIFLAMIAAEAEGLRRRPFVGNDPRSA